MAAKLQRVVKQRINQRTPGLIADGGQFDRVLYEEVMFTNCHFKDCSWTDCRFRRTHFSRNTRFERCVFRKCAFDRAHTYMGGPSFFTDCRFEDCVLDSIQFWNSSFERCAFSGRLINVVFYGPASPGDWETRLHEVNFTAASFEDVDFRLGIDLSTTRLPAGYVPMNVPQTQSQK